MTDPVGNVADRVRMAARQTRSGQPRSGQPRSGQPRSGQPGLRFRDRALTWPEIDAAVDGVARGLRAAEVADGDRVVIALPNIPEFALALFGALRAGLVAVPVNPGYTGRELTHVLADSAAQVLIGTPDLAAADLPGAPVRFVTGAAPVGAARPFDQLARTPGEPVATHRGGDDLAVLLYTSGTSGMPKGAMLSHRAVLANQAQVAAISPPVVGPDDVVMLALPLFHAYGLGPGLLAVTFHGCTGLLVERFDPMDALDQIQRHGVSVVLGVPTMYVGWSLLPEFGEAFASVRVAVCGAAPLSEAAQRRFMEATSHPVIEGYGLTECAPVVTSALMSPVPKPGSIGRPIPGVEVRLVGADGQEIEIGEDEDDEHGSPGTDPGELWVRGANLFSGYWPDAKGGPDEDGWWATADVAYADEDGDLFLVDRLDELILVSGFNVYPHEVESVLVGHPAVSEAAVLGVPHPYTGQAVKAYVVLAADAQASVEELITYCERNLARFKCPTSVEFASELPHTLIGNKVRKTSLRELP